MSVRLRVSSDRIPKGYELRSQNLVVRENQLARPIESVKRPLERELTIVLDLAGSDKSEKSSLVHQLKNIWSSELKWNRVKIIYAGFESGQVAIDLANAIEKASANTKVLIEKEPIPITPALFRAAQKNSGCSRTNKNETIRVVLLITDGASTEGKLTDENALAGVYITESITPYVVPVGNKLDVHFGDFAHFALVSGGVFFPASFPRLGIGEKLIEDQKHTWLVNYHADLKTTRDTLRKVDLQMSLADGTQLDQMGLNYTSEFCLSEVCRNLKYNGETSYWTRQQVSGLRLYRYGGVDASPLLSVQNQDEQREKCSLSIPRSHQGWESEVLSSSNFYLGEVKVARGNATKDLIALVVRAQIFQSQGSHFYFSCEFQENENPESAYFKTLASLGKTLSPIKPADTDSMNVEPLRDNQLLANWAPKALKSTALKTRKRRSQQP